MWWRWVIDFGLPGPIAGCAATRSTIASSGGSLEGGRAQLLGKLCPLCFDQLAEIARVKYSFVDVEATSWSDRPVLQQRRRRR